ncbi:DUF397 domain-containing protein [Micromonospora sp. NPDC002389]|uniref:DUF397 domain-containing protein n=1 Tax=Micromonospora sp. NPDC002389 TaxID=3154272 RepID=UPI003319DD88
MSTPDLSAARWFTSSRSANNGDCVECAILPDAIAVRDSKDRSGPVLVFSHSQWSVFVTDLTTHRRPTDLG